MTFFDGQFSEELLSKVNILMYGLRDYDPGLWIGDSNGPQRESLSIRINVKDDMYILIDPNSENYKLSFHPMYDVYGTNGYILETTMDDGKKICEMASRLIKSLR